ncbi:MAG: Rieske (2Fe-2S) protein [Nitriliruptorales bacterium]|nr:Rieske (2Fe-2S) protein [Nitriliruptorales bacterium]
MSEQRQKSERAAVRSILAGFVVAVIAAVVFMVEYALDASTQVLGVALLFAFGGIGYSLTAWAHRLMPRGGEVEDRKLMHDPEGEQQAAADYFRSRLAGVQRRGLLGGALAAALGALGLAVVFPFRSLGPRPGDALRRTDYAKVPRPKLVTSEGRPVHRDDLPPGGFLTVFPEGFEGSANAQTALIRLDPDRTEVQAPTREEWVVEGYIAYSKICTHAGCPVGEYQQEFQTLFCPCHQSSFEVLRGASPVLGPADRPLPQLPIGIDEAGFLVALGDFDEAVGPGWWTRPKDGA